MLFFKHNQTSKFHWGNVNVKILFCIFDDFFPWFLALNSMLINLVLSPINLESHWYFFFSNVSKSWSYSNSLFIWLIGIHQNFRLNCVPINIFISDNCVVGERFKWIGIVDSSMSSIPNNSLYISVMNSCVMNTNAYNLVIH